MRFASLFLKLFLPLLLLANSSFAADAPTPVDPDPLAEDMTARGGFGPEDDEFVDPKVLRDFIESRGLINCRQKCGTLTIAGDVRARWILATERFDNDVVFFKDKRGFTDQSNTLFKSEFNLFLDYVTDNSWVTTKLKWAVIDGVDPPQTIKTELDRAFIGYDVYNCCAEDFYVELGRTKLDYMFESRIEFSTFFNGIHFYYTNEYPVGTLTLHGGPFVVDAFNDHYAYVAELGMKDVLVDGFSFRYSIIDWFRFARTTNFGNFQVGGLQNKRVIENNPRYRFLVSQMLLGYETNIDFYGCKVLYLYAAALANHLAKRSPTTDFSYANKAWYVGFTLGKLCKGGDWSIDANYQYCQAQAVPEFDLSGIGHGNATNSLFSDALIDGLPPGEAKGFTNYRGFQLTALYALSDTFSFRVKAEWTRPINANLGGDFRYKAFEMSAIYAF